MADTGSKITQNTLRLEELMTSHLLKVLALFSVEEEEFSETHVLDPQKKLLDVIHVEKRMTAQIRVKTTEEDHIPAQVQVHLAHIALQALIAVGADKVSHQGTIQDGETIREI